MGAHRGRRATAAWKRPRRSGPWRSSPGPLREHYDDFNDFMRRNIAEYKALAAQLPEAYAHPLGQ